MVLNPMLNGASASLVGVPMSADIRKLAFFPDFPYVAAVSSGSENVAFGEPAATSPSRVILFSLARPMTASTEARIM